MKLKNMFVRTPVAEALPAPLLEYQSPTASLIAHQPSFMARNVPWALLIFLLVIVFLSIAVPINIVITGYGSISTDQNIDVIQPVEISIVKKIFVKPGDHVTKGQLLAELDPTFTESDLGSLQAQFDAAQTDVERLRAEVANKPYVPSRQTRYTANSILEYNQDMAQYRSTVESYKTKLQSLQATLQADEASLQSYQQQYTIAAQVLAKRAELARLSVGSQLDLLSAQSQADQLLGEQQSTAQQVAAAKQDIASMQAEMNAYQESFYQQQSATLASRAATMDDADSQLSKNMLRVKLVDIRADQAGSVLTVATANAGTVLQGGDQLMTIQPDQGKIVAQVDFPAEYSGYLRVGQKVAVKFLAFNYTTHGQAYGTLDSLTSSSFLPGAQQQQFYQGVTQGPQAPTAAQTSLPETDVITGLFYQGQVTINDLQMRAVPPGFRPTPGMAITADAIVGKRNTFELLAERIIPAFSEYGNNSP